MNFAASSTPVVHHSCPGPTTALSGWNGSSKKERTGLFRPVHFCTGSVVIDLHFDRFRLGDLFLWQGHGQYTTLVVGLHVFTVHGFLESSNSVRTFRSCAPGGGTP